MSERKKITAGEVLSFLRSSSEDGGFANDLSQLVKRESDLDVSKTPVSFSAMIKDGATVPGVQSRIGNLVVIETTYDKLPELLSNRDLYKIEPNRRLTTSE